MRPGFVLLRHPETSVTPRFYLLMLLPLLGGCARMFPGKVADGVASLTVRDLGGVLMAVDDDTTCGFASRRVDGNPEVTGALGATGTATWTAQDCVIDLGPELVELSTDCNGVTTSASGQVTVSARKVVTGRYTGDPATPVIPETPDAATFFIDDATFADFEVTQSNSGDHMRVLDGSLQATVVPQLATDAETGACSVFTPRVSFHDIQWRPSTVEVTSGERVFDVPVGGGSLDATNGAVGDQENSVAGTLTVWNHEHDVALSGLEGGLDPDYDPAVFESSYTCDEALAQPVRFTCPLDPILAEGAARLIAKNFALVTMKTDADTRCGFGNMMEQITALIDLGAISSLFTGSETTLDFNADHCDLGGDLDPIITDCLGTQYFLDGTATVTGTKSVTGKVVLSVNPLQPQDPTSAVLDLPEMTLDEARTLELRPDATDYQPYLTMHDGALSGTFHPITGEAADTPGAYFIVVPVGGLADVSLHNSDVTLHEGAMQFPMHVDDSSLYAFTGGYLDDQNWLYGTVTIDGTTWPIGSADAPIPLDPEYDQATFDATYECTDNLKEVVPVY